MQIKVITSTKIKETNRFLELTSMQKTKISQEKEKKINIAGLGNGTEWSFRQKVLGGHYK